MQYKKKLNHFGGPVFLLKRSSLGTSDIQSCYSPKGITYIIYILMYERHQIPFRTTYIEYRSPVNIFINFIGFHCKNMFFCHSSPTPVVGDTLRWAWKTHFFHAIIKSNWSFRRTCFLLKRSSLGTSDIQGCYSHKGITYMIYIDIYPYTFTWKRPNSLQKHIHRI